jgi:hypothetical protein
VSTRESSCETGDPTQKLPRQVDAHWRLSAHRYVGAVWTRARLRIWRVHDDRREDKRYIGWNMWRIRSNAWATATLKWRKVAGFRKAPSRSSYPLFQPGEPAFIRHDILSLLGPARHLSLSASCRIHVRAADSIFPTRRPITSPAVIPTGPLSPNRTVTPPPNALTFTFLVTPRMLDGAPLMSAIVFRWIEASNLCDQRLVYHGSMEGCWVQPTLE